jgi:RNA polymerase sigma factor (sigma-70 family)
MSDEAITLVNRWREGDEDAAKALYEQYFAKLMHIVSGHLTQSYKKQVDPEDVLQSAFGTVFRRISNGEFSFESDGDVWKLLVTVVLNKLRHRVRYLNADRRDIRRELRAESDFDGVLAAQLSQPPGISEAAEFAELVRDIFEFLPEQERMLLQLRMDGYGQQEIAERLDVTDRTVRRMWDRIRDRLTLLLGEDDL